MNRMDSRDVTNVPRLTKYQEESDRLARERTYEILAIIGSTLALIGFLFFAYFGARP